MFYTFLLLGATQREPFCKGKEMAQQSILNSIAPDLALPARLKSQ